MCRPRMFLRGPAGKRIRPLHSVLLLPHFFESRHVIFRDIAKLFQCRVDVQVKVKLVPVAADSLSKFFLVKVHELEFVQARVRARLVWAVRVRRRRRCVGVGFLVCTGIVVVKVVLENVWYTFPKLPARPLSWSSARGR